MWRVHKSIIHGHGFIATKKIKKGTKVIEYIGEKVLAYDPVPGQQKGCVDLIEATGGKSWSI